MRSSGLRTTYSIYVTACADLLQVNRVDRLVMSVRLQGKIEVIQDGLGLGIPAEADKSEVGDPYLGVSSFQSSEGRGHAIKLAAGSLLPSCQLS